MIYQLPPHVKIKSNNLNYLFEEYLNRTGENLPEYFKEHEIAHYNMARKLGYSPQFTLIFSEGFFTQISIDCEGISNMDLIKIVLAPIDPSPEDLFTAKKCREELRR